jgi:hypothetical protein
MIIGLHEYIAIFMDTYMFSRNLRKLRLRRRFHKILSDFNSRNSALYAICFRKSGLKQSPIYTKRPPLLVY